MAKWRMSRESRDLKLRRTDQRKARPNAEVLETRALLATVYVNVANTSGIETGSSLRPYSHIQTALDRTVAGDTIRVSAGTYAEAITVNHPVKILGPNSGVNPNTTNRKAEAIVLPATNSPNAGAMILLKSTNVTIDGLTIDGHNGALTGGTLLNGVSSNALTGIGNVDVAGNVSYISGINVANNVIRNLTGFGFIADINDFTGPLVVSSGNIITQNKIDNIPLVSPVPGRGISIETNFYADVTNNVITRAGTGIQAIFSLTPSTSTTPSKITGNTIQEYDLGIFVWNIDSESVAYNVSNNTVTAATDGNATPTNTGIKLYRIDGSSGMTVSANTVSGAHVGIALDYVPTSRTITVTGAKLTGNDIGFVLENTGNDPYYANLPSQAVLQNSTISNSKIANIEVIDALNTTGADVNLTLSGNRLSGSPHNVILSGANAHVVEPTAPTITLTSSPPASTTSTSATFKFTLSDNLSTTNDLLVLYSLDGAEFFPATSPLGFTGLPRGSHTILFVVTDQAGNTTKLTYSWMITG